MAGRRLPRWTMFEFEPFGLSCAIFEATDYAILLDPGTPRVGLLSQRHLGTVLTVTYGPDATLDVWLERLAAGGHAQLDILERASSRMCDLAAERTVVHVTPPPTPVGSRLGSRGVEHFADARRVSLRVVIVGTRHRETPLLAVFQRPIVVRRVDPSSKDEAHFFASFRCRP
jgi:hypothetical protein